MAIIYEKKDHIADLTINRPEAINAMDIGYFRPLG